MATKVFPITAYAYPLDHTLRVDSIVNTFGDGQEQRIITALPRSRANGFGSISTYAGINTFTVTIPHIPYRGSLRDSVEVLWNFYQSCFYENGVVKYDSFYWYNPQENDNTATWTGDTPSSGTNSRGENVTNATGRYRVRFADSTLTKSLFMRCTTSVGLELVEVVE